MKNFVVIVVGTLALAGCQTAQFNSNRAPAQDKVVSTSLRTVQALVIGSADKVAAEGAIKAVAGTSVAAMTEATAAAVLVKLAAEFKKPNSVYAEQFKKAGLTSASLVAAQNSVKKAAAGTTANSFASGGFGKKAVAVDAAFADVISDAGKLPAEDRQLTESLAKDFTKASIKHPELKSALVTTLQQNVDEAQDSGRKLSELINAKMGECVVEDRLNKVDAIENLNTIDANTYKETGRGTTNAELQSTWGEFSVDAIGVNNLESLTHLPCPVKGSAFAK